MNDTPGSPPPARASSEVAVLRVVGPPGSGKTLLIVSLTEALRSRGHRVATVVRREALGASLGLSAAVPVRPEPVEGSPRTGAAATVIVLSNGGRVTIERALSLQELRTVVPSIDPSVQLMLAEGYADAGFPAIALAAGGAGGLDASSADVLAIVTSEEIAGAFARFGPGETNGLADLVEARFLGGTGLTPHSSPPPQGDRGSEGGRLGRMVARVLRRGE